MTTLIDLYNVRLGDEFTDMSAEAKSDLLKEANQITDGKKKGLIITFDLSSSYRLTNNRLYSAQGQKAGISSWTSPYPKPILRNHDRNSDPIGRIISVDWVSNDTEAIKFFDSTNDFMKFKRVMDSGEPKSVYREMRKRNLLTNEKWPGLGKLVAKARISDPDAIEKFLDGRYFTFSAGSTTDAYHCGICGDNWASSGPCEHSPGSIDDEGRPAVMITGTFIGREASVVTVPGNDLSKLTSMEFGDSAEVTSAYAEYANHQDCEITFVDASVFTGDNMAEATNEAVEVQTESQTADLLAQVQQIIADKDALALLKQALFDKENEDASDSDGKIEGGVQVSSEESNDDQEEEACSEEEGNVVQEDVQEEVKPEEVVAEDAATEEVAADDAAAETQVESLEELAAEDAEVAAATEAETEAFIEDEEEVSLDWYLLDAALDREMGDKMLSAKQRKELPDEAFCGPERSFPVPDCDHVTAARRMIGLSKLSTKEKGKVLSCVARKEKAMKCASEEDSSASADCGCNDSKTTLESVIADYKAALKLATDLQAEVDSLKEQLSQLDTTEESSNDDDNKTLSVDDVKPVESESVSSAQVLSDSVKELGNYEKKIVSKYNELRDASGDQVANRFLRTKIARGHLPRNFDITPHIQENE